MGNEHQVTKFVKLPMLESILNLVFQRSRNERAEKGTRRKGSKTE